MNSFVQSLFDWVKTFEPCEKCQTIEELYDGFKIAEILSIIASTHFNLDWLAKLKHNVSPDNWRLRVSNLKKILDKTLDYYENVLLVNPNIELPDVVQIGRDENTAHLCKLLQLLLGIAVNCENKQLYIENITKLDLFVQQNLMEAIQQLMTNQNDRRISLNDYSHGANILNNQNNLSNVNNNSFIDSLNFETSTYQKDLKEQLNKALENLKIVNEKKESILQQNFELSKKLNEEKNEKLLLQQEHERILEKFKSLSIKQNQDDLSIFNNEHLKKRQVQKLQSKIEALEKDLMLCENQKEENSIKLELMEKALLQLRVTNEDLQRKVKEAKFLQDELDVYRHSSDKVIKYEQKLDIYKKRLEEYLDLKKEFKALEEKNLQLVATNLELEEELKKPSIFKQQIQDYKKQIQELHQEIIEKTHKSDKLEFDLERQLNKYDQLNQEKNRLEKEKNYIKNKLKKYESNNSDIFDEVDSIQNDDNCLDLDDSNFNNKNCLNFEINELSNDLKEKLTRIEHENKLLKNRLEQTNQEAVLLLKTSYQDAKFRAEELESDNRKLNRKIIELESKLNDLTNGEQIIKENIFLNRDNIEDEENEKRKTIEAFNNQIYDLEQKLTKLQGDLSKKDDEFNEIDAKYKKYVLKAKEAVNMLEPISVHLSSMSSNSSSPGNSSINSFNNHVNHVNPLHCAEVNKNVMNLSSNYGKFNGESIYNCNNIDILKKALKEKDRKINELILEIERDRNLSEMESRLLTVAVHNVAFNLCRKAATDRTMQQVNCNNQFNGTEQTISGHSSILSKQRQSTSRRNNHF